MTAPGRRVRALATRWCSERARRRLIDPALADLQAEYAAARRTGSRRRMVRALAAGYVAIAKVLLVAGGGDLRAGIVTWQPEERAGARHAAGIALTVVAVVSGLLEYAQFSALRVAYEVPDWRVRSELALYLAPSVLPLGVPLGLAVAAAWLLHGAARTRKLATAVLVVAALASAGMFANVAWLVPETNQAFRERALAELDPHRSQGRVRRGDNELTLSQAQERLRQVRARADGDEVRRFEAGYYRRWAMSLAPLPIVALVAAMAFRRRWTRAGLTSVALAVCAVNYAVLMAARSLSDITIVPPIVLGWTPDAICGLAALLLACSSRYAATSPPAPTR